ncbi:MAG: ABC transporter substrate-binding protein [Clostridia bacterium]|nr:ABC transporter substrate-binding protein [Clostridia bacterium]
MQKMRRILAVLLVLALVLSLAVACRTDDEPEVEATPEPVVESDDPSTEPEVTPEPEPEPNLMLTLSNYEYGVDYTALYEVYGADVTIADVIEDPMTGLCYIERDGNEYELGLDFLTMAMVYNTEATTDTYPTPNDVYAAWWRLYMQRWNYLVPEIPLYSNEYYDLYNAQIEGVVEHPTNPYWGPSDALIDWTSTKEDNGIIIGNTTALSGKFRYANFGSSNPGASDLDVQNLIHGLETIATTKEGGYEWNETVVAEHDEVINDDGSKTFTIKIHEDLVFSDGSPVTAKNYVVHTLVFSSPVAAQAAGRDHRSGMTVVGYDTYSGYTGVEAEGTTAYFSGLRLLDDYTFSVTISSDYIPYFYDITYAGFSATYLPLWLGEGGDIADDGEGCYIVSDTFYAAGDDGVYTTGADHIYASAWDTTDAYPYSGPYVVESYDETNQEATLVKNPNYKGNYEGTVPSIERVVYKRVISSTQLVDFQSGGLDVIAGITGGDETNEALALADASNGAYVYTHYSRAGYGKLGMRCDYGPVQFTEVRQAIAYCLDRARFATEFTGGYGGVVDGPYYTGSWMYQAAVEQGMILNSYATSLDSAIAVLEEGGWIYDAQGNPYESGVRYKKILAEEATENIINYRSQDGTYVTTFVDGDYYMPLALNWFGTTDNEFSDQLLTGFMNNDNIIAAGFVVQNQLGEFAVMLDELYQMQVYGYYSGTPMYCIFNFATGFTSAAYDYSYNMTVDPSMYDDYSAYYIKDAADIYWLS